ncbi:MAG: hypothetical protein Q8P67_03405 [archaeon]|nr:hypothetical protein [archaeon]
MSKPSAKTGPDALLAWCAQSTESYKGVQITDFTSSWKDGKALCALIHKHRPGAIPWELVEKGKPQQNISLALQAAKKLLPPDHSALEPEDFLEAEPGAMIAYVSQFFFLFRQGPDAAGRGGEAPESARVNVSTLRKNLNLNSLLGRGGAPPLGMYSTVGPPGSRPVRAPMPFQEAPEASSEPSPAASAPTPAPAPVPAKELKPGEMAHLTKERATRPTGTRRLPTRRTRPPLPEKPAVPSSLGESSCPSSSSSSERTSEVEKQETDIPAPEGQTSEHEIKDDAAAADDDEKSDGGNDEKGGDEKTKKEPQETEETEETEGKKKEGAPAGAEGQKAVEMVDLLESQIVPRWEAEMLQVSPEPIFFSVDYQSFRLPDVDSHLALSTLVSHEGNLVFGRIVQLLRDLVLQHPDLRPRIAVELFNEVRIINLPTAEPREKDCRISSGVMSYSGVFKAGAYGCLLLAELDATLSVALEQLSSRAPVVEPVPDSVLHEIIPPPVPISLIPINSSASPSPSSFSSSSDLDAVPPETQIHVLPEDDQHKPALIEAATPVVMIDTSAPSDFEPSVPALTSTSSGPTAAEAQSESAEIDSDRELQRVIDALLSPEESDPVSVHEQLSVAEPSITPAEPDEGPTPVDEPDLTDHSVPATTEDLPSTTHVEEPDSTIPVEESVSAPAEDLPSFSPVEAPPTPVEPISINLVEEPISASAEDLPSASPAAEPVSVPPVEAPGSTTPADEPVSATPPLVEHPAEVPALGPEVPTPTDLETSGPVETKDIVDATAASRQPVLILSETPPANVVDQSSPPQETAPPPPALTIKVAASSGVSSPPLVPASGNVDRSDRLLHAQRVRSFRPQSYIKNVPSLSEISQEPAPPPKAPASTWKTVDVMALSLMNSAAAASSSSSSPPASSSAPTKISFSVKISSLGISMQMVENPSTRISQIKESIRTLYKPQLSALAQPSSAFELCLISSALEKNQDVWLIGDDTTLEFQRIKNGDQLEYSLFENSAAVEAAPAPPSPVASTSTLEPHVQTLGLPLSLQKPVELEGYLLKRGSKGLRQTFKRRFFRIQDNRLLYFEHEPVSSSDQLGYISLGTGTTVKDTFAIPDVDPSLLIEISTPMRIWYLQAEHPADRDIWLENISQAIKYWATTEKSWLEGFLTKRGGIWKSWLVRWCILRSDFLYYYEAKDNSYYQKGKIPLYGASVLAQDENQSKIFKGRLFGFSIATGARVYYLCANSQADREAWIAKLLQNVYALEEKISKIRL